MIDNDNATADLLFVTEQKNKKKEEKQVDQEIAKEVGNPQGIPGNYIEVKLSSLGKLTAPEVIHVRNYTFEEALELSEMTEDNEKDIIIRVLNEMIWEDVDANDLHEEEALEILLNIYARWWGTKIEGFKYLIDDTLEGEERNDPSNISVAEIPISNINTAELSKEVKEPFTLKSDSTEVSLKLPRMKTSIIARNFVNKKYIEEENKFGNLKRRIRLNQEYGVEEHKEYMEYLNRRGKDYLRAYQAQLIHSVNGREIESFSEGLEILSSIDLSLWKEYNSVLGKHFSFGIDQEVTFECTVGHHPITRRFLFRPMVFLPSVESENDTGYTLSFG